MADQVFADTGVEVVSGSEQGEVLAPYNEPTDEHVSLDDAISDLAEGGEQEGAAENATSASPDHGTDTDKSGKRRPLSQRFADVEKRGYEKARAEVEKEWQSRLEQQRQSYETRLVKLQEIEIREEAQKLAKSTGINIDFAIEHIKLSRKVQELTGEPASTAVSAPRAEPKVQRTTQRDESGKFTAAPDIDARAQQLMQEADEIMKETGFDVLSLFQSNETIREAVAGKGMSFKDIYNIYGAGRTVAAQPQAVRSGTSGKSNQSPISSMSEDAFKRLNDQLSRGHVFKAT